MSRSELPDQISGRNTEISMATAQQPPLPIGPSCYWPGSKTRNRDHAAAGRGRGGGALPIVWDNTRHGGRDLAGQRGRGRQGSDGEDLSTEGSRTSEPGRRSPRSRRRERSAAAARGASNASSAAGTRDSRPWIIGGVVAVIIVGLIGLLVFQEVTKERPGIALADLGNLHVEVDEEHELYNSSPPTSGPHYGFGIAPANIYRDQIEDELQVHSLEDAHVMVQYDCMAEECPGLVAQLGDTVQRAILDGKRVALAPYTPILDPETGARHRIALTAWTRIDVFHEFDEERIEKFINAYEGIDHHPLR